MKLNLTERKPEAPGVESFVFEATEGLRWKAGQFFHYVLHHEPTDDRGSDRWFTVASAPSEGRVQLTTRFTDERGSSFKRALANLKTGEAIEISDIDGDFTLEDTSAEYVFIAGGIGVTPFRAILKDAENHGVQLKATLLYSNRDENIPYRAELDALARKNPNLTVHYVTGARIDEACIRQYVPDVTKPLIYLSGPEPMVEAFGKQLLAMGVPKAHLKQDWFPGYPLE